MQKITYSQGVRQDRLISTHNMVPMNKDLEPKHLAKAIAIAKGEGRKPPAVTAAEKPEEKNPAPEPQVPEKEGEKTGAEDLTEEDDEEAGEAGDSES